MSASTAKKEKPQPIHVYLRIRPPNKQERDAGSLPCVEVISSKELIVRQQHGKKYSFERVFDPSSKQVDVYMNIVHPLIREVLAGYNCTVFAYGQTGTGKTYTMAGGNVNNPSSSWLSDEDAGIIPRALAHLFEELHLQQQQEFSVRVSYLELYNEDIFDLLSDAEDNTRIRIYEDQRQKGSVIVHGIEEVTVCNKNEVYKILEKGQEKRRTATTLMNASSSRSHTLFCITVYARETTVEGEEVVKMGKLNLVDLAGSENINRSGAVDIRAREAGSINQSLLTLGRCIKALVERCTHIPYRESKLTRLLQDSLGGRTKTSIIATISPTMSNLEETLSTLEYAYRARNITNRPEVNQRLSKRALICQYTEEIERLKKDLSAAHLKNGIYLAQENYERLIANNEYQKEELAEKITIIRDLEKKISLVEQEKALKEKQWEDLCASLKVAQEHLTHYETTQKILKEQAETLLNVAKETAAKESKLHEKVDHFYQVNYRNRESANRLMNIVEENFASISQQLKDFQQKYDYNQKAIYNATHVTKQNLEEIRDYIMFVLERTTIAEDTLDDFRESLDSRQDRVQKIREEKAEQYDKVIQEILPSVSVLVRNSLNDISSLQEKVKYQRNDYTEFMLFLQEKFDFAKQDILHSAASAIAEVQVLKERLNSEMAEINKNIVLEEELRQKLMDLNKSNTERLEKLFKSQRSSIDNLETQLRSNCEALDTFISDVNDTVKSKQNDMTYFDVVEDTLGKIGDESKETHRSTVEVITKVIQNIKSDTMDMRNYDSTFKEANSLQIEEITSMVNTARDRATNMREFVEAIEKNSDVTIDTMKELSEYLHSKSDISQICIDTCKKEVKKIIGEELLIVEPTGETPQRTRLSLPKRIAYTSPKQRTLDKFRQLSEAVIEDESKESQTFPLQENNSFNKRPNNNQSNEKQKSPPTNQDKENILK